VCVPLIESLLAGKAVDFAFDGVTGALRGFFKEDDLGRLLLLLYADYGEETDLGRDVFFSWRAQDELAGALGELLAGTRGGEGDELNELAALIEPRLVRTPDEAKPEVAARLAHAAVQAAPLAVGGGAARLMVNRFEAGQRMVIEAIGDKAGESSTRGLAAALVVGPLRQVEGEADVQEAERLAQTGAVVEAAQKLLDVVDRLNRAGLPIAAEALTERSGALLAGGGEREAAVDVLVGVVEARVDRGARWAAQSTLAAVEPLVGEDGWIVSALQARIDWPEVGVGALEPLRAAVMASRGRPDHPRWLSAYTAQLVLFGDMEPVIEATEEICETPRMVGARIAVELDRLDALDARDDERAKEGWLDVLRWVDREARPAERGLAWQRRGLALARREQVAEAEDAYRRAIEAWAAVPGYEEQAADAFLSLQGAYMVNGKLEIPDVELRPLAVSLRGISSAPVALADRIIADGMSHRLTGSLPEAMYSYWIAYAIQRRCGSLVGMLSSAAVLAELYAHAGESQQAMLLYVIAGNGKDAATVLDRVYPPGQLAQALKLNVPRWERAAAYHVIARHGRTLPVVFVDESAATILEEARKDPGHLFSPEPAYGARKALAAVLFALPDAVQTEALAQLRMQLENNTLDVIQESAQALILATNAGLTDATAELLEIYLRDPYNLGISPMWIAERAAEDTAVSTRLRGQAQDGHQGALEALAIADLIGDDDSLVDACRRIVEDAAKIETITETQEGDQTSISVGMGIRLERHGTLARSAPAPARELLVEKLLAILTNPQEPETNRASAAGALFNLAPVLDLDQAARVYAVVEPLALGKYDPSRWDEDRAHPLSRFRLSLHIPNALRVAALGTVAQLVAKHPELGQEQLQQAVFLAAGDQAAIVLAAALDAASRVPDLALPFPPETALESPDGGVRLAGFEAWAARHQELPADSLLDRVLADSNVNVRLMLARMAINCPDGGAVLQRLADGDPDGFVRVFARHHLTEGLDVPA
jgi:tetratricopeptide (TPR) repeat protein